MTSGRFDYLLKHECRSPRFRTATPTRCRTRRGEGRASSMSRAPTGAGPPTGASLPPNHGDASGLTNRSASRRRFGRPRSGIAVVRCVRSECRRCRPNDAPTRIPGLRACVTTPSGSARQVSLGQRYPESLIVPEGRPSQGRPSAISTMPRPTTGSLGGPAVWPSGASTSSERGGLTRSVIESAEVRVTVTKPAASIARAARPTD